MFFRLKKVRSYSYLQIVENHWSDGKSHQRVIATLAVHPGRPHAQAKGGQRRSAFPGRPISDNPWRAGIGESPVPAEGERGDGERTSVHHLP